MLEWLNKKSYLNDLSFYKRFTMDTIWNCAFGVDIQVQDNPDNEYFVKCEQFFKEIGSDNILNFIGSNLIKNKLNFKLMIKDLF